MVNILRKKLREKYSDKFLIEVVSILDLPKNFRFIKENIDMNINKSTEQINKITQLCFKNEQERISENLNQLNMNMNTKWSYEVCDLYFNIKNK